MELKLTLLLLLCVMAVAVQMAPSPTSSNLSLLQRWRKKGNNKHVSRYQLRVVLDANHVIKEKVIIDMKSGTETFIVPGRGDYNRAEVVDDYGKRLTVIHNKDNNKCYISREYMIGISPRALTTILKKLLNKTVPLDNTLEVDSTTTWKVVKALNNRSLLSRNMAKLCRKSPVFWIRKVEQSSDNETVPQVQKRFCSSKVCIPVLMCIYVANGRCILYGEFRKCREIRGC